MGLGLPARSSDRRDTRADQRHDTGTHDLSSSFYQPALLTILAPGGFITLGILMALFRNRQMKKEEKESGALSAFDGWHQLDACGGCALKGICGGGSPDSVCAKQAEEDKTAAREAGK
ncbi:MAG: hypothetical protein ACLUEQ_11730 [Cloacibacillus evryensis]